jgi:hypothetical protein
MKTQLDGWSKKRAAEKSEIVLDALRQYFTCKGFDEETLKMVPYTQKIGILIDEDVFKLVS